MKKLLATGLLDAAGLAVVGCGGGKTAPVAPSDEPTSMPQKDEKGRTVLPSKDKKIMTP